jgi:hypothetical protein
MTETKNQILQKAWLYPRSIVESVLSDRFRPNMTQPLISMYRFINKMELLVMVTQKLNMFLQPRFRILSLNLMALIVMREALAVGKLEE